MACLLYKKGDTHTVRGVKCIRQKFEAHEIPAQLQNGWVTTPQKTLKTDDGQPLPEPEEVTPEPEIINVGELKNPEIRELAAELGIENAEIARIETLKKAIIDAT
jgi:hypothetical protein